MSTNMQVIDQEIWGRFEEILRDDKVPEKSIPYLRNWGKNFGKFDSRISLTERSLTDVRHFLEDLCKRPGLKIWQWQHANRAMRLLYQKLLPAPWATPWPIDDLKSFSPEPATFPLQVPPSSDLHERSCPALNSPEIKHPLPSLLLTNEVKSILPATIAPIHSAILEKDADGHEGISNLHKGFLGKLQTRIRTLHYSIRTERAYKDWVRRFFAFVVSQRN